MVELKKSIEEVEPLDKYTPLRNRDKNSQTLSSSYTDPMVPEVDNVSLECSIFYFVFKLVYLLLADLIELMMIQNAQMHQVIMNNMTMSALSNFGYYSTPPAPMPSIMPVEIEDDEPMVYHHHYESYPASYPTYPTYPTLPPMAPVPHREPTVRHLNQDAQPTTALRSVDLRPVPPPPPMSATSTVGADIPPATEYYDLTEARM
ncbi:hypothetical protein GDO78_004647 [Eleutherodactylus coqui]|uniref:DUF4587 domain-containing protein n=1 Tax=Eleutherodactylus coqui TaxID=57060 RepID=A0A8J6ET01_ELECQ|nr:hypothetical protein GDO78_004647 [Eleutherodactylus coqui]